MKKQNIYKMSKKEGRAKDLRDWRVRASLPNLVSAVENNTELVKDKKEETLINSASADSVRTEKLRRERYIAGGRYYG